MITLIETGGESLHTLEGALDLLGFNHCRAATPDAAAGAGPIVLLGSGPYDGACAALKQCGWWWDLPQLAASGRPVLGIGLGLQLLAEGSEESPRGTGLGLIPGIVRRLGPRVKVPHWGWSPVRQLRDHPLFGAGFGTVALNVSPTQPAPPPGQSTPFSGTPVSIIDTAPTTIEAENFDNGGEGVAYHDTDTINQGGSTFALAPATSESDHP